MRLQQLVSSPCCGSLQPPQQRCDRHFADLNRGWCTVVSETCRSAARAVLSWRTTEMSRGTSRPVRVPVGWTNGAKLAPPRPALNPPMTEVTCAAEAPRRAQPPHESQRVTRDMNGASIRSPSSAPCGRGLRQWGVKLTPRSASPIMCGEPGTISSARLVPQRRHPYVDEGGYVFLVDRVKTRSPVLAPRCSGVGLPDNVNGEIPWSSSSCIMAPCSMPVSDACRLRCHCPVGLPIDGFAGTTKPSASQIGSDSNAGLIM